MKHSLIALIALLTGTSLAAYADTVREFRDDESGDVSFSDQQQLQGATEVGTVKLDPGPTEAEQQAAQQRADRTKSAADEMEQSRLSAQQQRQQESTAAEVDPIVTGGGTDYYDDRRELDRHLPIESRDGGDHIIYQPGKTHPAHRAAPAGRAGGRGR